ncbi:hypothetical protein THAOC_19547, partial [Thalassiosira oceanica]
TGGLCTPIPALPTPSRIRPAYQCWRNEGNKSKGVSSIEAARATGEIITAQPTWSSRPSGDHTVTSVSYIFLNILALRLLLNLSSKAIEEILLSTKGSSSRPPQAPQVDRATCHRDGRVLGAQETPVRERPQCNHGRPGGRRHLGRLERRRRGRQQGQEG